MEPRIIRIKASAGSGKTYRLSLRYLALLKELGEPSPASLRSVVAITFTNKAAAEMKERILGFLKEIAFGTPRGQELWKETGLTPEEARNWIDTIVRNYSDFQVRTIDSFLYSILKGLSFELGIHPEAEARFNHEEVILNGWNLLMSGQQADSVEGFEEALRTYLSVEGSRGFYPEWGFRRRIAELFRKVRGKLDPMEERVKEEDLERAEETLNKNYQALLDAVKPLLTRLKKTNLRSIYQDGAPKELDTKGILRLSERAILTKGVDELLKKGETPSPEEGARLEEAQRGLRDSIESWREINSRLRSQGYLLLLEELGKAVDALCKEEGILLGGDWTRIVREEMKKDATPALVDSILGGRLRHTLFDEFQDTSREQWEALYPLLENSLERERGGTLFLVGDVKQAIYRWRGGDWTLFDQVAQESCFGSISKEEETLNKNFRSHPQLVEFFNSLFAPLGKREEVKALLWENSLNNTPEGLADEAAEEISRAFSSHRQEAARDAQNGATIELYKCKGSTEEVEGLVRPVFVEKVGCEWEKRGAGSAGSPVAVLVRSRNHANLVSDWLLQEGIPVVTEESLHLQTSGVVKGLLCLLRHLHRPEDTSALYGLLASGLLREGPSTEEELTALGGEENYTPGKPLEGLRKEVGRSANKHSPYDLLQCAMESLGLKERLEGELKDHRPFVERLLEVAHNFVSREGPDLGRFLRFWEEGGLEERVGLPENLPAVRVLTIHKAKGLEFPAVFIPFTNWTLHPWGMVEVNQGRLAILGSKEELPQELRRLKAQLLAKEAQELLNLFYVAVTRAEEALYLFITLTGRDYNSSVASWAEGLLKKGANGWQVKELDKELG